MESILFNPSKIWIAESENGNMIAKFALCDFSVNLNGTQLNRETIEQWMGTMINQPLVGKIVRGALGEGEDFAGHQMQKTYIKDENGVLQQVVTFDTNAYGTFVDIGIEEIDGNEYVVATAEIWNRYPKTVQLIKRRISAGTLRTSWEIEVSDYTVTESGVKVINLGYFKGLAMLGERVQPAYPDASKLLAVAEAEDDDELLAAMQNDMKETDMNEEKTTEVETSELESEPSVETAEDTAESVGEPAAEVSEETAEAEADGEPEAECRQPEAEQAEAEAAALEMHDLRVRIEKAVREKLRERWCYVAYMFPEEHTVWIECEDRESILDYILFVYTVEGDEVAVDDGTPVKLSVSIANINETLAQKDAAIAAALAEKAALEEQVASLSQIKVEYDKIMEERTQAETDQKKAALRAYAMKSGLFTEGELTKGNAKKLIDALDQAGINQMIADRYMAKLAEKQPDAASTEVAEAHTSETFVDLTGDDVRPLHFNAVRAYYEN